MASVMVWNDIKPLVENRDSARLENALPLLPKVLPATLYRSISELWDCDEPRCQDIINMLLKWGTPQMKLIFFQYLVRSYDVDTLGGVEDAEGRRPVHMEVAARLLTICPTLVTYVSEVQSDRGVNVLHYTVQYGTDDLLAIIIQLAKDNVVQEVEALFTTAPDGGKSPMTLIVEFRKWEMLLNLLSAFPNLTIHEDFIKKAIQDQQDQFLIAFAQLRPQCATPIFLKYAVSCAQVPILRKILREHKALFLGHGLLSDAVTGGNIEVVRVLIEACSELAIERDCNGNSALSHLGDIADEKKRQEIRLVILPHIIRMSRRQLEKACDNSSKRTVIEMIRMWLAEPKDLRKEICLDLGGFRDSSRSTEPFLRMIKLSSAKTVATNATKFKVEFESTLRYVDIPIPNLPGFDTGSPSDIERSEAKTVLEWLRKKNKVVGIYELRIRDSIFCPHSEEVISQSLAGFDIEILDWMRADMSVEPLLSLKKLQELKIYASNWATLSYWTSEEVIDILSTFSKLKKIEIFILSDVIGANLSKARRHEQSRAQKKITTAVEVTRLGSFIKAYNLLQEELKDREFTEEANTRFEMKPYIKVAVIDTGVDPDSINCHQISGASFVPSSSGESPWWFSHHPHGTQMAKMITELNPHCQLLVAKIGDSVTDMTVSRLIEALEWATDSEADIISLSAAFFKEDTNLEIAIKTAINKGIVIVASIAGEGHKQEEAYPANYAGVLKIGAADSRGKETPESLKEIADYMFPGDRIVTRTTFLGADNETTEISGTSVATAIAAGVASLVLACHRLSLSTQHETKQWNYHVKLKQEIVKRVLGKMAENRGKFVQPSVFFNEADQIYWGEAGRTLNWLKSKKF
ncbi:hypothetical protein TWF694_010211 [Orbilia ellipsospora]|uniref:Peptidase S8/S53 domain-containing protein n=1 Tax=Orbilia ellipsospora TaxID=2528407 RepID=A0AAV9X9L9_9PEZI